MKSVVNEIKKMPHRRKEFKIGIITYIVSVLTKGEVIMCNDPRSKSSRSGGKGGGRKSSSSTKSSRLSSGKVKRK